MGSSMWRRCEGTKLRERPGRHSPAPRHPFSPLRHLLLPLLVLHSFTATAQTVDSLHIFRSIPAGRYTTSSAETTAWKLAHEGASFVFLGPAELDGVNHELGSQQPEAHNHTTLPGLSHIGFVYYGKRAHAFCLSEETGLLVDLTARRQVRMADTLTRMKLKAALLALGL